VAVEVGLCLRLHTSAHRLEEGTEIDRDVHGLGFDLNVTVGPLAIELKGISSPLGVDSEFLFKLLSHAPHRRASILEA